jgi:hypothetical protein
MKKQLTVVLVSLVAVAGRVTKTATPTSTSTYSDKAQSMHDHTHTPDPRLDTPTDENTEADPLVTETTPAGAVA